MATPAAVQAALDGSERIAKIIQADESDGTKANYYVVGGVGYAGRSRWCETTAADSAANQATAILAKLAS